MKAPERHSTITHCRGVASQSVQNPLIPATQSDFIYTLRYLVDKKIATHLDGLFLTCLPQQ